MSEETDEKILATLQRIERLLMHIANNTREAVPYNQRHGMQTVFYPDGLPAIGQPGVYPVTR